MVEHLITAKDEGEKAMRDTCKSALKEINRNDDNCPILPEKIIFNLFSHYMSIKKVRTQECIYLPPAVEISAVH